jgi:Peptide N-acetyl-beta-D-glucosaminyl asparaginase amidase A
MASCRVLILWTILLSLAHSVSSLRHEAVSYTHLSTHGHDTALLDVFQVYPPPISATNRLGSTACTYTLMNHVFSNSAGKPYVGKYYSRESLIQGSFEPLCGNDWDIAALNLSVISYGRQFDRLGVLSVLGLLMAEYLDRKYRDLENVYC